MINRRWLILIVLFLARTSFGYQFQIVASSAAAINMELELGYALIGSLIGLYNLPGAVLSVPGGMFGARYGDRMVCAVGLVLMISGGVLMGMSNGISGLMAGRLISGAGSVLFNLVLTKMLTDWFAGREIVFAMGTLMSSWPFGIALALVTQGRIAESFGWRTAMLVTSAFCALSLLLILAIYRPPPSVAAAQGAGTWWNPPDLATLRCVLIASLAWSFFNLGIILLFSFGTPLLASRGFSRLVAGDIISAALWVAILSIPLGGYALQRSGGSRWLANGSYLLSAVALIAFAVGIVPLASSIIFGIALGVGPGAIMALPSRVLKPENRMTGLGLFMALYGIVVSTIPWLAGLLTENAGSEVPALLLGAALMIACIPMMVLFDIAMRLRPTPG